MKVRITKTFEVRGPVAKVWSFLTDPRKVATCVPGAQVTEAVVGRARKTSRAKTKAGRSTTFAGPNSPSIPIQACRDVEDTIAQYHEL